MTGPNGPARKPCPRPDRFQPWMSEVRAQSDPRSNPGARLPEEKIKQSSYNPQLCHSPRTPNPGPCARDHLSPFAPGSQSSPCKGAMVLESSDSAPTSPKLARGPRQTSPKKPIRGSRGYGLPPESPLTCREARRPTLCLPAGAHLAPGYDPLGKRASGAGGGGSAVESRKRKRSGAEKEPPENSLRRRTHTARERSGLVGAGASWF